MQFKLIDALIDCSTDTLTDALTDAPRDVLTDTPTVATSDTPRDAQTNCQQMQDRHGTYTPTEAVTDRQLV